jgi:hypothetical protein
MRAIVAYTVGDPRGGIEHYQRGAYVISTSTGPPGFPADTLSITLFLF